MNKPRVAVVGYGVIGQRLADGVARQADMELAGVVDIAPTLSIRALREIGMPYRLFVVAPEQRAAFDAADIPVSGTLDELLGQVDIVLDATPGGVGRQNKEIYQKRGIKAVFQGGEKNDVADVFFHGYANYEKGIGRDYLKLTSCNTTGLIRAVDCLDRAAGVERVIVTIVRRVADPGDTHRGLVDVALVDPVPSHQALDLMTIMPHIEATGLLVHVPTTHGHIIHVITTLKEPLTKEQALHLFEEHPRIRVVKIKDGFNSNTALFRYARDLGNKRADMYEIAVFDETIAVSGREFMFAISVPQEAVVTPETMDAVRAALEMQTDRLEAVGLTNRYLGMSPSHAQVAPADSARELAGSGAAR
jgi:glyceraldehyde-3-phosphate dehydrogenase (NAD(P))